MSELGEALKTIFGKISAFFDLFDLSFFVSGAVSLSALIFWLHLAGKQVPFNLQGWLKVLAIILGCYVSGLFCFAVGRWIHWFQRKKHEKKSNDHFREILEAHGLADERPFSDYLSRAKGIRRLYTRLWAEVRQMDQLSPSLSLLNRYWVMAATYDGSFIGIPMAVVLFMVSWRCFMESSRLVSNQREELVATIAVQRARAR
jgi:hypothetical protein